MRISHFIIKLFACLDAADDGKRFSSAIEVEDQDTFWKGMGDCCGRLGFLADDRKRASTAIACVYIYIYVYICVCT